MDKTIQRQQNMTRLMTERAALLEGLLWLDETILTTKPVHEEWTVKDILAHIAAWDRWEERTMKSMVAGNPPDFTALQDFDASNAEFVASWRNRSLDDLMYELMTARSDWVTWLESLSNEEFFQERIYSGYEWAFSKVPLKVQWEHDAEHAIQIDAWREIEGFTSLCGPKSVLLASLEAARLELLASVALVPVGERETIPVCGDWTLKDLTGHIADWEWYGVEGLHQMSCHPTVEKSPRLEAIGNIDAWNISHVEARRNQPWERVWEELHTARQSFLNILSGMKQREIEQIHFTSWGGEETPYEWVITFLQHDRHHSRDLAKVFAQ